jgi:hypothetical protein
MAPMSPWTGCDDIYTTFVQKSYETELISRLRYKIWESNFLQTWSRNVIDIGCIISIVGGDFGAHRTFVIKSDKF